jgi:G3E family GTPase
VSPKEIDRIMIELHDNTQHTTLLNILQNDRSLCNSVYLDKVVCVINPHNLITKRHNKATYNFKHLNRNNYKDFNEVNNVLGRDFSEMVEKSDIIVVNNNGDNNDDVESRRLTSIVKALNPFYKIFSIDSVSGDLEVNASIFENGGKEKSLSTSSLYWNQRRHMTLLKYNHNCIRSAMPTTTTTTTTTNTTSASNNYNEHNFDTFTFVYQRRRPFHPQRFNNALETIRNMSYNNFDMLLCNDVNNDTPTHISIENTKIGYSISHKLLRTKGLLWMAFSHTRGYHLSHIGQDVEISEFGQWWDSVNRTMWPNISHKEILSDFSVPYGDRRQEIICTLSGLNNSTIFECNRDFIIQMFDTCLLTTEEMSIYDKCIRHKNTSCELLCDQFL